jgi:hypothetical protein
MPLYATKREFEKCSICDKKIVIGEKFIIITTSLWRCGTSSNEQIETRNSVIKCLKCYGEFE